MKSIVDITLDLLETFDEVKNTSIPIPPFKGLQITTYKDIQSQLSIERGSIDGVRQLVRPGSRSHYKDRCLVFRKDGDAYLVNGSYEYWESRLFPDETNKVGFK